MSRRNGTANLVKNLNPYRKGDQGHFLALLVRLISARRTLEIGTFTGYSALAVALALPEHGQVVACDISEEWTGIGRRFWERSGMAKKIEVRIAPALKTLRQLESEGNRDRFDLAFIGTRIAERIPNLFLRFLYVGVSRAATYFALTCEGTLPKRLEPNIAKRDTCTRCRSSGLRNPACSRSERTPRSSRRKIQRDFLRRRFLAIPSPGAHR
jgi:SAM-dependent methyltransferase